MERTGGLESLQNPQGVVEAYRSKRPLKPHISKKKWGGGEGEERDTTKDALLLGNMSAGTKGDYIRL